MMGAAHAVAEVAVVVLVVPVRAGAVVAAQPLHEHADAEREDHEPDAGLGAALAVFAPMSMLSMAIFTSAFAWVLTRPVVAPLYRTVLVPALGAFGLVFGLWYAGIT